jgi:hypothetical protein
MKGKRSTLFSSVLAAILIIGIFAFSSSTAANTSFATTTTTDSSPGQQKRAFTDEFFIEDCDFTSTGTNPYLILEPNRQAVFRGEEDGEAVELVDTVLDETEEVQGVETRVFEERETHDGELAEISRNFFAICEQTNSVFYFGEDVQLFENGQPVAGGEAESWRAGEEGARAGIIMPGTVLLGARYFEEIAPDVAEDRAEIISLDETVDTPAGTFDNVLKIEETTPLEPGAREFKFYARDVGLIQDGDLKLVESPSTAEQEAPQEEDQQLLEEQSQQQLEEDQSAVTGGGVQSEEADEENEDTDEVQDTDEAGDRDVEDDAAEDAGI